MMEGEHVIGRDPDVELFFDLPGISRRHALVGSPVAMQR